MTDLKNGIINLDGLDIGPDTTFDDIKNYFPKIKITPEDEIPTSLIRVIGLLKNEKGIFHSCLFQFKNGLISGFEITPHVDSYPEGSNRKEKQEVRRKLCNDWLYQWLGEPDRKDDRYNDYDYFWGGIASISHLDPREEYDGGYISAIYNR